MSNKDYLIKSIERTIQLWNNIGTKVALPNDKAIARMRQCIKRFFKELYYQCMLLSIDIEHLINKADIYKSKFGFNYII